MSDTLIPLEIPPGMYRNGTAYQAKGRWYDGALVRFFGKTIAPVGGWRALADDTGLPIGALDGIARGVFAWRGAAGDQYLTFGTTTKLYLLVGGVLHDITPVGFVGATSEDTESSASAGAYGAGTYGTGLYGAGSVTSMLVETSNWHLDNFGNYLAGVSTSDNKLYIWAGDPAVVAAEVTGADHPTSVTGVVVTPEGFLVALGWAGGAANVRGVVWASQRTSDTWTPALTNSAGDFELATSGRLMAAKRTRSETLLWTDVDLHVMEYIGGPLVYRFAQAGEKCGAISPRSPVVFDTKAMWMGNNNFFVYDGRVQSVECDVAEYVFGDMNTTQATKIWGMTLAEFGEAWWFYPSSGSTEIDRYVVYNYREGHWTVGQLSRTAGVDAGASSRPILVSSTRVVFEHEVGVMSDIPGEAPIVPFLQSGPIQLGEGDRLMRVRRIVPDERTLGDVLATFSATNYPTAPEEEYGPYFLANPTPVRLMARQVRIKLTQFVQSAWRVGTIRLGVKPGSRR